MLEIPLGEKFTSSNFESTVAPYWDISLTETNVVFNLTKLEWIANEQVTFLVSWINKLSDNNVQVRINLQESSNLESSSRIIKRRAHCLNMLVYDWRIISLFDNDNVKIVWGDLNLNTRTPREIPYKKIPVIDYQVDTFDENFDKLYNSFSKEFTTYVKQELREKSELNYFDNHFLHYSLIKEFYSNVCQHAFDSNNKGSAYLSLKINSKISKQYDEINIRRFLKERYEERASEERLFFQDQKGNYQNKDYIEITFLDFGKGIVNTLREKYLSEDFDRLNQYLNKKHHDQTEDNRILEYAFLLFTSRYEFKKDLEQHDYIPRGLYIIKDIVKRYKGMIVARSGEGKIIFNFNKRNDKDIIDYSNNVEKTIIGQSFSGTMITLIFPTKQAIINTITSINKIEENKQFDILSINIFELFLKSKKDKNNHQEFIDQRKIKLTLVESFFEKIYSLFLSAQESDNGKLILFDFAGTDLSTNDVHNKLIYFLAYCPLINNKVNVCLYNLTERGINNSLVFSGHNDLRSKGFYPKPIPCVYVDLAVEWIGINNPKLENKLTDLWKGSNSASIEHEDYSHLEGNVLRLIGNDKGQTYFSISTISFDVLLDKISFYNSQFIQNEILNKGLTFNELVSRDKNFNNISLSQIDIDSSKRVFITPSGNYQNEFISFMEKLYVKEYRKLVAVYLLFNLCYSDKDVDGHEISMDSIKKVTKIVTVTLSSQLIGKEFVDLINDLNFLNHKVDLVPLSNYHDFSTEESFQDINSKENIILVNDIVSTGNLATNVYYSLKDKHANLSLVICLVDTRTRDDKNANILHTSCLSLTQHPIEKLAYTDDSPDKPISINSILNAPMVFDTNYLEEVTLIEADDFLKLITDDEIFLIGNFNLNSIHPLYYIDTKKLFEKDRMEGFDILRKLITNLKQRNQLELQTKTQKILEDLKDINKRFDNLISLNKSSSVLEIKKSVRYIEELVKTYYPNPSQLRLFNDIRPHPDEGFDYIFYPFFSSISDIEKFLLPIAVEINNNDTFQVYPIPRIMTPKGWRFSLSPKFIQLLGKAEKKRALIFDDGSFTGGTLIQMIESCIGLNLTEITVLIVISRLEDFNKEFFSRVKEIRGMKENIPISIHFGTHLDIPVYTKNDHPFNVKVRQLKSIEELDLELPEYIKNYLNTKINQYDEISIPGKESHFFFPENISKKEMFSIRNFFGKYDSYKFFSNDIIQEKKSTQFFEKIISDSKSCLTAATVLYFEPKIVETIKRINPLFIKNLSNFLTSYINSNPDSFKNENYFHFIIETLITIDIEGFLSKEFTLTLLDLIDFKVKNKEFANNEMAGDIFALIYTTYLNLFLDKSKQKQVLFKKAQFLIREIWFDIYDSHKESKFYYKYYRSLYNQIVPFLDSENVSLTPINSFHSIFKYYGDLTLDFINHRNLTDYNNFEKLIATLQGFINVGWSEIEIRKFITNFELAYKEVSNRLLSNFTRFLNSLSKFKYLPIEEGVEKIREVVSRIDSVRQFFLEVENNSILLNKEFFDQLKDTLQQFIELIISPNSELSKFVRTANSDIQEVWNSAVEEYNFSNNLDENIMLDYDLPEGFRLNIHPFVLVQVFLHILNNRRLYASGSLCEYKVFMRPIKGKDTIVFYFRQTKPFIKDFSGNRGLSEIRRMISFYGGEYYPIDTINYTFEITFPIEK